jgi:acyl-CoA thioesterase-1
MAFVAVLVAACGGGAGASPSAAGTISAPRMTATDRLRYVALGDSYTIGTSVAESERWPNQLVEKVPGVDLVANLGVNGFTSDDVIRVELPQLASRRPEVVTLLIGVNDVVQGVPESTYRGNVAEILDRLVELVDADHVIVLTTPDYTVTPSGSDFGDPTRQSAGIRKNNQAITELATARGVRVVDIYDISLLAVADRTLVAPDGLHPSGAQYARWVERVAPPMQAIQGR